MEALQHSFHYKLQLCVCMLKVNPELAACQLKSNWCKNANKQSSTQRKTKMFYLLIFSVNLNGNNSLMQHVYDTGKSKAKNVNLFFFLITAQLLIFSVLNFKQKLKRDMQRGLEVTYVLSHYAKLGQQTNAGTMEHKENINKYSQL